MRKLKSSLKRYFTTLFGECSVTFLAKENIVRVTSIPNQILIKSIDIERLTKALANDFDLTDVRVWRT